MGHHSAPSSPSLGYYTMGCQPAATADDNEARALTPYGRFQNSARYSLPDGRRLRHSASPPSPRSPPTTGSTGTAGLGPSAPSSGQALAAGWSPVGKAG